MKKYEIFTVEDFRFINEENLPHYAAAEIANEKLAKLIESWPVVYGYGGGNVNWSQWNDKPYRHSARLAFIQKLPTEPCKYKPDRDLLDSGIPKCIHCGVELVAEWKAK